MAKHTMTLEQMQETRKWFTDLSAATGESCAMPGYRYIKKDDIYYAHIEFNAPTGEFLVTISNDSQLFSQLADAEAYLFNNWVKETFATYTD